MATKTAIARPPFKTIEDIRRQLSPGRFHFIDLELAEVLYSMPHGWCGYVHVIGHPGDASYEWVASQDAEHEGDERLRVIHSDVGYGCPEAAMRDGLNGVLDDGEPPISPTLRELIAAASAYLAETSEWEGPEEQERDAASRARNATVRAHERLKAALVQLGNELDGQPAV